jgi:hypothetical protein
MNHFKAFAFCNSRNQKIHAFKTPFLQKQEVLRRVNSPAMAQKEENEWE